LTQVTPEGDQVILHLVHPGEMFGGIAVLGDATYPVSAQALEDCQALAWDGEGMAGLMERTPRLALNALRLLAGRVQELQDRVRELATERVERRVARTLLRLARQAGRKVENGVWIDLPLSRQDLAEMTGTTLFTVSRVLSRWEQQGLVEAGRERVLIRFPHGLVRIAEDLD
jgi:CRP-like cAMP-binding protein